MIAFKTFYEKLEPFRDYLVQQQGLHEQLKTFFNEDETVMLEDIVQINELILPDNNQLTLTVWYREKVVDAPEHLPLPIEESADVLSRSLREPERRERINTMVDEHIVRSNSS